MFLKLRLNTSIKAFMRFSQSLPYQTNVSDTVKFHKQCAHSIVVIKQHIATIYSQSVNVTQSLI